MNRRQPGPTAVARHPAGLAVLTVENMLVFAFTGIIGPLYPAMARSLPMPSVQAAGWLVGATSLGWGVAALLSPELIGRLGCRRLIAFGLLLMGLADVSSALAPSFAVLLGCRFLGGVGGGTLGPATNLYVVDTHPPREQATAFGWLTTGTALGGALLVPLLMGLADTAGWRWALALEGGALVGWSITARRILRARPSESKSQPFALATLPGRLAAGWGRPGSRRLLLVNLCERSINAMMVTYWPTLLVLRYHWSLGQAAWWVGLFYACSGVGSVLGGYGARRLPPEREGVWFAAMLWVATAWAAADWIWSVPALWYAIGGSAYALMDNSVRPLFFRRLAASNPTAREALLSLFALANQSAGMVGSAVPSLLLPAAGVLGLGVFGMALAVGGGVLMWQAG